jgi:sugar/nucleoside kinase (ribokinase family)
MPSPSKVKIRVRSKANRPQVPQIAGAGICCLDHIFVAPPVAWGETGQVEDYYVQGGGLVATALVACARLGAECRLFSLLSNDNVGIHIAAELAAERISLAGVARSLKGASPFSFIHVDKHTGERTIFHRPAMEGEARDLPNLEWIARCDVLLVDDYYPKLALAAARLAKKNGIPVVADLTTNPDKNLEFFRYVNVLIVPRKFAAQIGFPNDLMGALEAMRWLGPETALITLGAEGWMYLSSKGSGEGKAFPVQVVDTTGAGDAFHGGFAYGLARRWDIGRCAEFAAAVAAVKCTKPGGRAGLPSLARTMDFLRKNGRLSWSGIRF